jgi:hypothetical protein
MSDWMPIETAPKDGRHVLAWDEGEGVTRCFWGSYSPQQPEHWCRMGLVNWGDYAFIDVGPDLTHWMPLPKAPR